MLLKKVEVADGIALWTVVHQHFNKSSDGAKLRATDALVSLNQLSSESAEQYIFRLHKAIARIQVLKVTWEDIIRAIFLRGLHSRFQVPKDFCKLQGSLDRSACEAKIIEFGQDLPKG